MSRHSKGLSVRSDQVSLPSTKLVGDFRDVLAAEAPSCAWRLVELVGKHGPFDAQVRWTSGNGVSAQALVTVGHSARLCTFARSIVVRARNLSAVPNQVLVNIADGQTSTRNQWESRGEVGPRVASVVKVPPFARRVRLDLADPALAANANIWLLDGDGVVRARMPSDRQPSAGVLLGGAKEVHVTCQTPTAFRLVFDLTL